MTYTTQSKLDTFISQFQSKTLPKEQWTHEAHFVAALWYVIYEPDAALDLMRVAIKSYNESRGGRNTDTEGYHETLTALYLNTIRDFATQYSIVNYSPDSVAVLLQQPFIDRSFPLSLYSKARLFSVEARKTWVEPDLV